MRRAYDEHLADTGLNQSEASVLALLDEDGAMSQSAIARRLERRQEQDHEKELQGRVVEHRFTDSFEAVDDSGMIATAE